MEKITKTFKMPEEERHFWEQNDPLDFVVEDEEVELVPTDELIAKRKLKSMTIRLDERQIADAKMLAARLRMPYQTYLRAMLSQVLENEKRKLRITQGATKVAHTVPKR